MRVGIKNIAIFTLVAGMTAGSLMAAPFEELFQIKDISGKCYIKTAGNSKFVKAEQNKAYPYGTSIKTDKKGSVTIIFSKDNSCVLKANTFIVLKEEANKKNKIIELDSGNIDVNLDKEFHKSNGLKVVTATGTCKAIGCVFSVSQSSKRDINASTYDCKDGKISVIGDDFNLPEMNGKDVVSVTTKKDNSFTRIETVKGEAPVEIKNANAVSEVKKTTEGGVIKIWRRASESGKDKIVTVLITDSEGALKEAITYSVPMPAKAVLPTAAAVAVPDITKGKKDNPEVDYDNRIPPPDTLLVPPPTLGESIRKQVKKENRIPDPTPTGSI